MNPIRLNDNDRKKPLSYDPASKKFLYLEDIKSGQIFFPEDLDEKSKQKLTLKRLEIEEDFTIESIGAINKEQQMDEIRKGTETGKDIVKAEIKYLSETIIDIQKGEIV